VFSSQLADEFASLFSALLYRFDTNVCFLFAPAWKKIGEWGCDAFFAQAGGV
jgi:hypothetical protein